EAPRLLPGTPAPERPVIRAGPRAARDFASRCGSPVAPRTVSWWIDRPVARKLRSEQLSVLGWGPLHVGDLRDRAPVGIRVSMAVETPTHTERRHQRDLFHLVDAAMTGDAPDAPGQVRAMVEIGEIGKVVDANPSHR